MLAHAFLTVAAAAGERDSQPAPRGLIPLTVNEFRRLFDALLLRPRRTIKRILDCQPGSTNALAVPVAGITNRRAMEYSRTARQVRPRCTAPPCAGLDIRKRARRC